jgi:hypothetical protein
MISTDTQGTSLIRMSLTMFQILVTLEPERRNMVGRVTGLALGVSILLTELNIIKTVVTVITHMMRRITLCACVIDVSGTERNVSDTACVVSGCMEASIALFAYSLIVYLTVCDVVVTCQVVR